MRSACRFAQYTLLLVAVTFPESVQSQVLSTAVGFGWVLAPRQVRQVPEQPLRMHEAGSGPIFMTTFTAVRLLRLQPTLHLTYSRVSTTAEMHAPVSSISENFARDTWGLGIGLRGHTQLAQALRIFLTGAVGVARSSVTLRRQSTQFDETDRETTFDIQTTVGVGAGLRWRSCEWQAWARMTKLNDPFGGALQWPLLLGIEC